MTTPDEPPQDEPAASAAPQGSPDTGADDGAGSGAASEPAGGSASGPEPTKGPAPEPASQPAEGSVSGPEPEPAEESRPEPQPGPTESPVEGSAPEPAAEPTPEPAAEPAERPKSAPAEEPIPGPRNDGEAPPPQRRHHWLRLVAICTAFLVLALGAGSWYLYQRLNGNIITDTKTETELQAHDRERPAEGPTKAENILLIGSDNRGSGNEKYGPDTGTQRSDTTILLHLAADRGSATAMSIPRDLMAHVPECTKPDGGTVAARFEQFNWAFQFGGAACTIRTVEDMTGVRIDHHLIVDFNGFKKMVNAVDGVDVCVAEPVHDTEAHLDLPAGEHKLNGEQALGYVRARKSIGDGSDTQRMERQQDFLASLISKVRSNGVLLNPVKLYPLLSAATSSLTADPGLDSLSELYDLAHSIQRTPTGAIRFLTLPREQYSADRNRDQLMQPEADQLFAAIRDDATVNVTGDVPKDGSSASPTSSPTSSPTGSATDSPSDAPSGSPTRTPTGSASGTPAGTPTTGSGSGSGSATDTPTAAPTYRGTTADRDICGKDQ